MNREQACRMLGIPLSASREEIKKKYRAVIAEVHPDSGGMEVSCPYSAHEINEAYAFLVKKGIAENDSGMNPPDKEHNMQFWSAPVCAYAYREREILENVTDEDGEVIGMITLATGRYFYTQEEEFPLFMKSLYRCSQDILAEEELKRNIYCDAAIRMKYQAELVYLLASEYIDAVSLLGQLAEVVMNEAVGEHYRIAAMLEYETPEHLPEGIPLYPEMLKRHRLYLMDAGHRHCGYLSFPDDRLYYCLIPLFEQRRVQIRIRTGEHTVYGRKSCQKLDLRVRLCKDRPVLPENLNLRIERLLEDYRRY